MTLLAASPPEATPPLLWQFFSHPVEKVRQAGVQALDDYLGFINMVVGNAAESSEGDGGTAPAAASGSPGRSRAEVRARLKDAEARAAALGRDVETLRAQLVGERREIALRDERLARSRADLAETERRLRASEESRLALEASRDRDAAAEARRHLAEAERLARELEALREALGGARRREAELLTRLKEAEASPAPAPPPAAPRQETQETVPGSGTPFQVPVFSPEFYDSIQGWDAHVVRAAFEKVLLLVQNLAHPGLDAKPMEGADGLYRIRVAPDVRLFYRRLPGGRLEILSLIDRDDLDRYIHRYRTRVRI